jgi:arylsulfatase A-like enzyme
MAQRIPTALVLLLLPLLAACASEPPPAPAQARPNILLVLADDLGYSDIAPYGSEVRTPNLARLAETGLIATDFYVAPDGGPTRAMLLTGVDHHLALRAGHLGDGVVTLASLLRDAGYHTIMAGRWELGREPEQRPAARGFERSFALLDDVASYWADMRVMAENRECARYTRDGELVESLPPDFYSTQYYTDFAIESIDANRASGRPFFAYLAYQAPHSPLSVPDDWRERYAGKYDDGFQAIQERRLTAQKRKGLVRKEVDPFPGLPTIPAWKDLSQEQRRQQARKMELYAAMVENLDFHLGRLLDHLDAIDARRDTLVLFLSDNGASASDRGPSGIDPDHRQALVENFPHNAFESWGRPGSFVEVGAGWGQTSSVPFRMFKGSLAEGGIRSPLVASGRGVEPGGRATRALLHVTDLVPTLLAAAGVEHPDRYRGRPLEPLRGRSLLRLLAGEEKAVRSRDDWLGFEWKGDGALRRGPWKAVRMARPLGTGDWQLYRLDRDPSELYDLAKEKPAQLAPLVALWQEYARAQKSSPSLAK